MKNMSIVERITPDIVKKFLELLYNREICMIKESELEGDWRVSEEKEKTIYKMYFKCSKGIRCAVFSDRFIWIKWQAPTMLGLREVTDGKKHHEAWQMYLAKIFGEEYIEYFKSEREKEYTEMKKEFDDELNKFRRETEQMVNKFKVTVWPISERK